MRFSRLLVTAIVLGLALFVGPTQIAHGATLTVDSTADTSDFSTADGVCDTNDSVGDGPCTLRAAIEQANFDAGTDTIAFSIAGGGPHTISPGSALPIITDPVIIDGYTQTGASPNTNPIASGSNAVLMIELDGTSAGAGVDGLNITAGSSTVKGLAINRFAGDGIQLSTSGGNTIQGNHIGTDVTGTIDLGNTIYGVFILSAPSNTIGGTASGARNVISGNGFHGVLIIGSLATGNKVEGNYIGTDVSGIIDLGNDRHGVTIESAPSNTIGGTASGARNIISGNGFYGVIIIFSSATGNKVEGNYIGTDATGTADLGNGSYGLFILSAPSNTIGGTASGARNVISGNDSYGVRISNPDATGNVVEGNYIGTDVTGTLDLGNTSSGVWITFAPGNTIGGTASGARNVISGNDQSGVIIEHSTATGNKVEGNYIGTDATGAVDLGNSLSGVLLDQAPTNTVGGTASGAGNVISGNNSYGVFIIGSLATGNKVEGNYIGTQADGTSALGNASHGVLITVSASNNTIGGAAAGSGNTIAFNGGDGVNVVSGTGNLIDPNSIHSNTGLGIDLGVNGVTANDVGDGDVGANDLQNYPVLTSALVFGSTTTIKGSLNSLASTGFALEFFSNAACDGSGNGEGETFVVSSTETTDGSGDVTFTVIVGSAVPSGRFIAATATNPGDNTSEFSACEEVLLDSDGDGVPDSTDVCPNDANDDVDGDGICVGNGFNPPKTGDNDNCPNTANVGQANADGDQWGDACDNCPTTATTWFVPVGDDDCDGLSTTIENYIGTDPNDSCANTPIDGDEADDKWPIDFTDNQFVNSFDLIPFIGILNTFGPVRVDLSMSGGFINTFDLIPFIGNLNKPCLP